MTNSTRPRTWLAGLFALLIATEPLTAQTTAPDASNPADSKLDEAIVLSPFVVEAAEDTGYQATSTLAGTRLNTPIKDIGASLSIYTKDFLADIGATNAQELLIFATGMEAAGIGGNYSGTAGDINGVDSSPAGPRENPQQTRTRGLASPNFTRGFFTTDIAFDSYNTESVTVNRGPNAILFGVGSPAGVVETTLLSADTRRNRNKIEARYGNNDSSRLSIDLNRVLIKDKLAMRIAALYHDEQYNQRPAFETKKRIFGTLTYRPFRSTALRANFESGTTVANRPMTVLPYNTISDNWLASGRPSFDWSFYDDPARNPNAAAQNSGSFLPASLGQVQLFTHAVAVFNNANATAPAFGMITSTRTTTGTTADSLRSQLLHPTLNRDQATDSPTFYTTRNLFHYPASYWTGANVLPGQQSGIAPAGIKQQGFTNFDAFDFKNHMLDETGRSRDSFHAFNVALEQRAWNDRIGFEVVFDQQRLDRRNKYSFFQSTGGNYVYLDPNVTLPTGAPNPNLGRPFASAGQNSYSNNFTDRETVRVTPYLRYDFKDLNKSWGEWLGRHTLTGLYENNSVDTVSYQYKLASDGQGAQLGANTNVGGFGRSTPVLVYLGPSIIGNTNPLKLEAIRIPELVAGPFGTIRYFSRPGDSTTVGDMVETPFGLVETSSGGNLSRQVIESKAVVLQSYWLLDHLITTAGWRRDESYFGRQSVGFVANPANLNDPGKVHYGFSDINFPDTPPLNVAGEIVSYSAVVRWPHKLVKLPRGTDLSVFYNKSENFTPVGGRVNTYNQVMPPPKGKTEEFGLNFFAFNDKFSMRVNRFETSVTGQSSNPTAYFLAASNTVLQQTQFWATEGNRNPGNVAFMNAAIETLYSTLPADYRSMSQLSITGTAPNISVTSTTIPGRTDTVDFVAKGIEIDFVYNPTRNLRILANIAKQETTQSNSYPNFQEFVKRMLPTWTALKDLPRNGYNAGFGPSNPEPGVETYGSYVDSMVLVPYATLLATNGSSSAEQRKWRANLVVNYDFGRDSIFGDKLNGWSIGGSVRWQDKLGIGYPSTRNPNNSVNIDLDHPYYAPAETNVDARIAYTRKICKNRMDWKVQLNVNNIIANQDPIAVGVQPWGTPSTVRLAPERRWYLTNTFTF